VVKERGTRTRGLSDSQKSVASPGPGRPRDAGVDRRVEEAVLALLREGGPAAVTMESVSARSGVAKTSIYRRHPDRRRLLTATLANAIGTPELPVGAVQDKLRSVLRQAWRQMADVLGPGGLAAIVGNSDPEFTELFRAALRPYDEMLVAEIRSDVEAGMLRAEVDADTVVSVLLGAYLGELVRHGSVGPDWLDRSMEIFWRALAPA
jgi:AcrR family transcriptional regulator